MGFTKKDAQRWSIWVALAFFFTVGLAIQINDVRIGVDSFENTSISQNMLESGRYALTLPNGDVEVTNRREPFLPFYILGWMTLHPTLGHGVDLKAGEVSKALKQANLPIFFLVVLMTGLVTYRFSHSFGASTLALSAVGAGIPFASAYYVNALITEYPSALFLLFFSLGLMRVFAQPSIRNFVVLGLIMGLLMLTRSTFVYLSPVVILFLLVGFWIRKNEEVPFKTVALRIALFLLISSAVALPWMMRNWIQLGSFEMSHRGGEVLLFRAYEERLPPDGIKAAFYAWAPMHIQSFIGRKLGYKKEDIQDGGKLAMLNDNSSANNFREALADLGKWQDEFRQKGVLNPAGEADRKAKQVAVEMIKADPAHHLLMSVPFFWRGIDVLRGFAWGGKVKIYKSGTLCILLFLIATICFFESIYRKKMEMVGSLLMPFGMVGLHALVSHDLARYNLPAFPIMVVAVVSFLSMRLSGLVPIYLPILKRKLMRK